jgi:hypothetical protein
MLTISSQNKVIKYINHKNLFRYLGIIFENGAFFLSSILLIVWALPGTIALRNLLIAAGFFCGIFLLLKNRTFLISRSAIPIYIFSTIFLWVLFHFLFIVNDYSVQLKELTSLWVRVLGVAIIGIAMGIYLQQIKNKASYFFLFFFTIPCYTILYFLFECYKSGILIEPKVFVGAHLKNKIDAAFAAVIGVTICVVYILWGANRSNSRSKPYKWWLSILGISISLLSAVIAESKNGISISCFILILGIFSWFFLIVKQHQISIKNLGCISIVLAITILGWKLHMNTANRGWSTLIQDVQISVQIDKHQNWTDTQRLNFPNREDGTMVAGNTYERVAWATIGIDLIQKHPLGYGTINHSSFKERLTQAGVNYPGNNLTHSGWIDFGLAFGVPGLLIIFSTLLSVIIFSYQKTDFYSLMALWLCIAIIFFGLVAEITFKHSFEILMFLIAFSCGCVIQVPKKSDQS